IGTRLTFDAHDIGCKPMAIAAAQASAMVGAIGRGLVAACDRLPVVIAETTRHTRSKPGLVQRAKEMIQPHFEASVHPADHVLGHGHASFFGGMWILSRKVLIHEVGNSVRDSAALAVLLDSMLRWDNAAFLRHISIGV